MTINYSFTIGWESLRGLLFALAFYIGQALYQFSIPMNWHTYAIGLGVGAANVIGTWLLDLATGKSGIKLGKGGAP